MKLYTTYDFYFGKDIWVKYVLVNISSDGEIYTLLNTDGEDGYVGASLKIKTNKQYLTTKKVYEWKGIYD